MLTFYKSLIHLFQVKIDLSSIDREQFNVEESIIISNNERIFFVKPNLDSQTLIWNQENKYFRSSIWNIGGELISAGFYKFVNWGENSQNFPVPTTLKDSSIVEKMDGSLLIVSKYNGHFILRTRGTLDASSLKNGKELDIFRERILPKINEYNYDNTWELSWLFEWTSPTHRIVIDYGPEPKWTLVGIVIHEDYTLVNQKSLDALAHTMGFNRPKRFTFSNVEELLQTVDKWKGIEGAVSYSNKDRTIHKVKSAWYLALHRMKTELASREKVIKVWFEMGRPQYNDFYEKVASQFDFELANQIRGDISIICDAWKEVLVIVDSFKKFVDTRLLPLGDPKNGKDRKAMADIVFSSYGKTNRASYIFTLLDGRELDNDALEKLLWQCIKNK